MAYHNKWVANPQLVKDVNKYYETHNKKETAQAFGLREKQVDHIVYHYRSVKYKQLRWTDDQIAELARMGGLISYGAQAKFFNRPRANEGSIKAAWDKKFKAPPKEINGMNGDMARHLVERNCPVLRVTSGNTRNRTGIPSHSRIVCLWVDMEKHLRPDVPPLIANAIRQLAEFQRWLHGPDARRNILKMIRTRETLHVPVVRGPDSYPYFKTELFA